MADAKFEEAIRLAFETSGTEGIKQAASIIASMGDVSEETRAQAAAMLDSIGNVEKTSAAAAQYQKIGAGIVDYQHQITEATAKVQEMSAAVKAAEAPTKAQQRDLAAARQELSALNAAQDGELAKLRALKTQLDAHGVSTKSAAAGQRDLAAQTATASANLRKMVTDLQAERGAQAAFQAELAATAEKAKKETDEYDAALKRTAAQIKETAAASKHASKEMGAGLEHTYGMLDRIKYMFAGIGAYLGAEGIFGGIKSILSTGDQFARYQKQLEAIYGTAAKGKQAFAWVKQFSLETPLTMENVMQAFIQLKNFGIDPMDGSLQSVIDQNAKLGGESERLQRITLAMGQAWARAALEGQDIRQMIEAGVPVWQLLTEVTGKSTAELQKMSSAGQLGRDVMAKLWAQMGKDASGAALSQMQLLSGQVSNLQDHIQQFEDRVARSGVMKWLVDQLSKVNAKLTEMANNGKLDVYAKRISNAFIRLGEAIKSVSSFIYKHIDGIKDLAKAYASIKIAKITVELIGFLGKVKEMLPAIIKGEEAVGAFAGAASRLRLVFMALSNPVGAVIGALALFAVAAKAAAGPIERFAEKHSAAFKAMEAAEDHYRATMLKLSDEQGKRAKDLAQYADVQVLTKDQILQLTAAELASYKKRLAGHIAYTKAVNLQVQDQIQGSKENTQAVYDYAAKTSKAYLEAKNGLDALDKASATSSAALKDHLSNNAEEMVQNIQKQGTDTASMVDGIGKLFADIGSKSSEQLGNIAMATGKLSGQAGRAGEEARKALASQLNQMSAVDLLNFQNAAKLAFVKFGTDAKEAANVLNLSMETALQRLGVPIEQWGVKTTQAGQDNIRTFQTVATNAQASAATIEDAFQHALANAHTEDDAKAIGDAMKEAGKKGAVGFQATSRAMDEVRERIDEIHGALDPLNADFAKLGIQSQEALERAANAAHDAFSHILEQQREGKRSIEDVRRAFGAYSQKMLATVSDSDSWKQAQVKASLEVQASVYGVEGKLGDMGDAGVKAGDKVAAGAHVASEALQGTADAAGQAADGVQQSSEALQKGADAAGKSAEEYQKQFRPAAVTLNGFSDALLRAYAAQNQFAGNVDRWADKMNAITAEWRRQKDAYEAQLESLNHQNAAYDKAAQRVEALRKEYSYLTDEQLRNLDAARQALEENEKRAKQATLDALKKNDAANAAQTEKWRKELGAPGAGTAGEGGPVTHRHEIKLELSSTQSATAVPARLNPQDTQRLAAEVVRQIGLSQRVSNR